MRKSHHPAPAEHLVDPLGLAAHAAKSRNAVDAEHTDAEKEGDFVVNPLWMITGALATFVILFFAIS